MNKKKILLALTGLLFFSIIVSNVSADYSGISVGDAWTYKSSYTDDEGTQVTYISAKVTSITSNTVLANMYTNGILVLTDWNISQIYVFSDSKVSYDVNIWGNYTASYGGRTLTVCTSWIRYIVDTTTGILVEEVITEDITFKLTSWKVYKESPSISGFSWFFTVLIIIGISAYLIRRGYNRFFIPNN